MDDFVKWGLVILGIIILDSIRRNHSKKSSSTSSGNNYPSSGIRNHPSSSQSNTVSGQLNNFEWYAAECIALYDTFRNRYFKQFDDERNFYYGVAIVCCISAVKEKSVDLDDLFNVSKMADMGTISLGLSHEEHDNVIQNPIIKGSERWILNYVLQLEAIQFGIQFPQFTELQIISNVRDQKENIKKVFNRMRINKSEFNESYHRAEAVINNFATAESFSTLRNQIGFPVVQSPTPNPPKIGNEYTVKSIIAYLDNECEKEFSNFLAYHMVKEKVKSVVKKNKVEFESKMKKDEITSRNAAYSWISNISGDLAESGQYHVYRGILNNTGNELLSIFDKSFDKMVEMGYLESDWAEKQKETIRNNIKKVG